MITAIVALPLLGFLIAGFGGFRLGARACEIVTTSFLMISAVLSWVMFFRYALGGQPESVSPLGEWFTVGALKVDWALRVDALTAVMLVVVTTVSALVHLYSIGYMAGRSVAAAVLRLSLAVHLRHADAGDGRQSRADVLWLGRRRPRLLPAHWVLVREADCKCRRNQGLRRQPRRRLRLSARHLHRLHGDPFGLVRHDLRRRAGTCGQDRARVRPRLAGDGGRLLPPVHGGRWASPRNSCCTPGCRTPWKAQPRCRR